MPEYYFDIETVPMEHYKLERWATVDPVKAKVISIQYQKLDSRTGKPAGELVILKEWVDSSSEQTIIQNFRKLFVDGREWDFIPVGNNLSFECRFMKYKLRQYCNLDGLRLGHRPMVDLKHVMVIMNGGEFKGYSRFLGKTDLVANMTKWYYEGNWLEIEKYVRKEAEDFGVDPMF